MQQRVNWQLTDAQCTVW